MRSGTTAGQVARGARIDGAAEDLGGRPVLHELAVPTLVVASHDAADPGHPYAAAQDYAERIPGARMVSEPQGQSPLAWQGGRLSREIEAFCAEPQVRERLQAGS